jgi:hypothetical protein
MMDKRQIVQQIEYMIVTSTLNQLTRTKPKNIFALEARLNMKATEDKIKGRK